MVLSEFEIKRIEKIVGNLMQRRRPPEHLRDRIDLFYAVENQSVVLYEKRQLMSGDYSDQPVAKATWIKTQQIWKIYWQRADLKWHLYSPDPEVPLIETFCEIVDRDEFSCFWG